MLFNPFNKPDISSLVSQWMLKSKNSNAVSQVMCTKCDHENDPMDDRHGYALHADSSTPLSTKDWVASLEYPVAQTCPVCLSSMIKLVNYNEVPKILVLENIKYFLLVIYMFKSVVL